MINKLALTVVASALFAVNASAAVIISLSGNPTNGPQFVVGSGNSSFVLDGSLVRIGTFESAPAANSTFAALESAFREFGRTTIGHTTAAAPTNVGRMNRSNLVGVDGGTSPDADGFFVGKSVYIWVYNSASADSGAAQGIFSTAQNTFQDQSTALSLSINQFRTAIGTHNPAENPTTTDINQTNNTVTFFHLSNPVPEPSSALIISLVAALGFTRRQR
jgi:hypothetical protein